MIKNKIINIGLLFIVLTAVLSSCGVSSVKIRGINYGVNLTELDLSGRNLTDADIAPLINMKNLKYLYLSDNKITNVSALRNMSKLTYLYIDGNKITDINALSGLTKLSYLQMEYNKISDIKALSKLTNLTVLYLSGNNITDVGALKSLTNLTFLDVSGNGLDQSERDALKTALPDCYISY